MTDIISHKYNFNLEDIRIYFIAVSVGRYLDRSNNQVADNESQKVLQ